MICVGIDVAKDKHDCFIMNSDGEVLFKAFTIENNKQGFDSLYEKICSVSESLDKIKVGLEATGHYSYNILGYLLDKGLPTIAEIGDFDNFSSPDKILAFAGLSPSTYQSGKMDNAYSHMEKRGSKYLRYALFNATKFVCNWDNTFAEYLAKKRAEGKHYNVAISHACKKGVGVSVAATLAPRKVLLHLHFKKLPYA